MQRSGDPVERYLGTIHVGAGRWFAPMAGLLALMWLIYPGIFFLDEQGMGAYTHPTTDALYTIVDVAAKVVYGFIFLGGILAIEKRAADAMGRSPMEMEEYTRFTSELTRHEGAESHHKLAALSADSGEAARERGTTAPSGGETIYEAEPKDAHEDREDGDEVHCAPHAARRVRSPTRPSTTGKGARRAHPFRGNTSSAGASLPHIVGKSPQNTVTSSVTVTRMWKALIQDYNSATVIVTSHVQSVFLTG
jgi:hypothetical protein